MLEFLPYGDRQDHLLKQRRQNINKPYEHKVVDRACIRNDKPGHSSESQSLKRSNISTQVVYRVVHPHTMSLQKSIKLITGIHAEQTT